MSNQNKKITELDELTSLANEDMFAVVDDPDGSPVTKKCTLSSIAQNLDFTLATHYHDGDTLQNDGTISNSGDYLLQSTGSINIKSSGFTSKYIELYTASDQPRIKIHGGSNNVFFESTVGDGATGAGFACWHSALYSVGITAYTTHAELLATQDLRINPNYSYFNYFTLSQDATACTIHAATSGGGGSSPNDLKLTASSGLIDFDDDNLETSGEMRFVNSTYHVGLEAPSLSATQIWVLPDADGSANEALITDGSGNLSFGLATPAAHTHDGDTLQNDGINSDGGAFDFITSGDLNFKVSGDTDDYLQLRTVGNEIILKAKGDDTIYVTSDDSTQTQFRVALDGNLAAYMGLEVDTNDGKIECSATTLRIRLGDPGGGYIDITQAGDETLTFNFGNSKDGNITADGGTIFFDDENLTTTGLITGGSLTLTDSPSVISSANAINLKPSGDADDYIEISTTSSVPGFKRIGGSGLDILSDDAINVYLWITEDGTHYGTFNWNKTSDTLNITSTHNLQITASSGTVSFDNEHITTSGTITGGSLTDSTATLTGGNLTVIGTIGASGDADLLTLTANTLTVAGTVAATTVTGANVTSGADPGHTHTGASLSSIDISADTNLAVTAPIVLTDDTLSMTNQGTTTTVLHGNAAGEPVFSAVDLANDVTGTLPATNIEDKFLRNDANDITSGSVTMDDLLLYDTNASHTATIHWNEDEITANRTLNFTLGGADRALTIDADGTISQWNTAYTHSQDNSQAHTDYLINNGADTTSGRITMAGADFGTNYWDIGEIAAPANPGANVARFYSKDDGGTTKLYFRDSAGTETELGAGGGGTPGGANTQVQFNDSGSFGGDAGLVYNKTTDTLTGRIIQVGDADDTTTPSEYLGVGASQDGKFYSLAAGTVYLDACTSDADLYIRANDGGTMKNFIKIDSSANILELGKLGHIRLGETGQGSTYDIYPRTNGGFNLGTVSNKFAEIRGEDVYAQAVLISTAALTTIDTGDAPCDGYGWLRIATEGGAASDDLDTLSGLTTGQYVMIQIQNAGKSVVVKNGTGNIVCGADFTMDDVNDIFYGHYDGTNVRKLVAANNA
jgi:hypothetical protein